MVAKQGESSKDSHIPGNIKTANQICIEKYCLMHSDTSMFNQKEGSSGKTGHSNRNNNMQKQKVIIPVPSSNLDRTGIYNRSQQDRKDTLSRLSFDSNIYSKNSVLYSKKYREESTDREKATISTFDRDRSNIDSLIIAEQNKKIDQWYDKAIMPVPNNGLNVRKANEWDEKIIIPISANESVRTGTHFRAEHDGEVQQGIQKLIMPVHYSSVNEKDLSSGIVTNQSDEKIIIPISANESVRTGTHFRADHDGEVQQGIQKLIMPVHYSSVNEKDLSSGVVTNQSEQPVKLANVTSLKNEEREQHPNEKDEKHISEHIGETQMKATVQVKKKTIGHDAELKSTAHVIHGVLKDTGTPQEISPSDRKHLFGDPRMTVLTSKHVGETKMKAKVQVKDETVEKHAEEPKSTAPVVHGVLKDTGTPQEVSPSDRKQLFGDPRLTALASSEIQQQTENIKKKMIEKDENIPSKVEINGEATKPSKESSDRKQLFGEPHMTVLTSEHKGKTKMKVTVQVKDEKIEKHAEEPKSTAPVIHGVLKDTGTPQEVSPADRKQLFGDPRLTVLASSEIEKQTKSIKKNTIKKQHEKIPSKLEINGEAIIPGKESPALVSGPLQSDRKAKKQKITNDTKQEQFTENEGIRQPIGLKSLKKGAKNVKKIVSSLSTDKIKDSTVVKKGPFNKSVEQPSNLKENVQKTSVTQFLYKKKYKDSKDLNQSPTEKPANNEIQDLHHSVKDSSDKASLLHSKQPHVISPGERRNVEAENVKPSDSLEKIAKKSSSKGDTSVKYVVSEAIRDNEIQRKALENNIKRKENSQSEPKNNISVIRRIYRGEDPVEKEQPGRITDDNINAIEKYLQQEISKVSPEKVKGNMKEPKKGGKSHTGENSKINEKAEADIRKIPSKRSTEQTVDKEKKKLPSKVTNEQHSTNISTRNVLTMHPDKKKAKYAISEPIKKGMGREQQKKPPRQKKSPQQKKPPQQETPPKEGNSSKTVKPARHSSFGKHSPGKNETDMFSSLDKYSTGNNKPELHSSFDKYSTDKNKSDMHSSFDKYSRGKSERSEEIFHDNPKIAEDTKTKHQQKPDLTEIVSHYSISDTKDTKLGHNTFQKINQQKEYNNLSSKKITESQAANQSASSAREGINPQSITLLDSPPRYMLKDIKESEVPKPSGDGLHPGNTQNTVWPAHCLSTVNKKYLGKSVRPSSWGDAGTFLPWVSYVAQKKNNQNNLLTEKGEGHGSPHVSGYGSENPFWQLFGRKYTFFKDNFNNHTVRGRANVAKATLLAVGLFTMWQILKPKKYDHNYQRCSECGTVTPLERK